MAAGPCETGPGALVGSLGSGTEIGELSGSPGPHSAQTDGRNPGRPGQTGLREMAWPLKMDFSCLAVLTQSESECIVAHLNIKTGFGAARPAAGSGPMLP